MKWNRHTLKQDRRLLNQRKNINTTTEKKVIISEAAKMVIKWSTEMKPFCQGNFKINIIGSAIYKQTENLSLDSDFLPPKKNLLQMFKQLSYSY